MKWKALHEHAIESDNGYVILRCTSNGKPTGRFITMLGRTTRDTMPIVLEGHDSAEDAKEFCEQHFEGVKASAA